MKIFKSIFWILTIVILSGAVPAWAKNPDWQNDKIKITIYQQPANAPTAQEFEFLIKAEMINGWHISWDNPGDAGIPTEFNFSTPEGWEVTQTAQTFPKKFIYDGILTQYGHSGTAYYLFQAKQKNHNELESNPKREYSQKSRDISLNMSWVACKDYCEPENADFRIFLPRIGEKTSERSEWTQELQNAASTFPLKVNWSAEAINQDYLLTLKINTDNLRLNTQTKPFYFIACERGIISASSQQNISFDASNRLEIAVDAEENNIIPKCGMLIYGNQAYLLNFNEAKLNNQDVSQKSYIYILLLAFVGGLILNLMPCIFPILSIKAISLAQSAQRGQHWLSGLLYLSGVLSCFILFAAILYAIRLRGDAAGWGFQLQSPVFVAVMLFIFIILLLMMLDIITPSGKFLNFFNRLGSMNSFMTGFFAVLIASPCTGPFMGAALGYALFQPANIYFPVFISLGLGYALPFALIEIFPSLIKKILPKPGKWMTVLKRILSVPIFLTCLWLGWVLYNETSLKFKAEDASTNKTDILWHAYNQTYFDERLKNGGPVFVDFTAKWCITCLVNEASSLNTPEFAELAKKRNLTLVKADWTNRSEEIAEALKTYGRNSIPLYVYYPGNNANYIILPQILTPGILREIIDPEDHNLSNQ